MNPLRSLFIALLALAFCLPTARADQPAPTPGYVGLAIERSPTSDALQVRTLVPLGPAAQAGLQLNDQITAINGISTRGMSAQQGRDTVAGPSGGTVVFTILRAGAAEQKITVTRLSSLEMSRAGATLQEKVVQAEVAHRHNLHLLFYLFATVYLLGGGALLYFTLRAPPGPLHLGLACGWIVFSFEAQLATQLGVFFLGWSVAAGTLMAFICVTYALPVILSSCGSLRALWRPPGVSWVTLAALLSGLALFIVASSWLYSNLYSAVTHAALPPQSTVSALDQAKSSSVWQTYLMVALILPAAEEVLFRGYLFDALRRRLSGPLVVVITAAVFALSHFQPLYFCSLFFYGLAFGWARLKTNSLRLSFFLHAANNAFFVAVALH